jgi:YebC/PmpR family DNA-binding regulatory protein
MSGHSKWASIKHKKGAADAKRGKIFTRHAKLIEISAREGGSGDLSMNASLKTAVENAKAENVPNANIDRAIKKGTGELKGEQTVAVTYEAYGPGGAAFIIECLTDNKNRTLSSVRSTLEKKGGRWAESGSVMYMFDRKGVVIAEKNGDLSEEAELELIDAGAEDIDVSGETIDVTTDATDWAKVRKALQTHGYTIQEAGLKYVPKQKIDILDAETAQKVVEYIEVIEEDDDVAEVHTNADMSEEIVLAIA